MASTPLHGEGSLRVKVIYELAKTITTPCTNIARTLRNLFAIFFIPFKWHGHNGQRAGAVRSVPSLDSVQKNFLVRFPSPANRKGPSFIEIGHEIFPTDVLSQASD